MFAIQTHNVKAIRSYEEAEAHFNNTPKPSRSTKWQDFMRPLRNVSAPHLRIERHTYDDGTHGGVPYYDLCLYQTPMVRYFKPNAQGERAIHMQWHYSNSSARFMQRHGWNNGMTLLADNNEHFDLPISGTCSMARRLWGDDMTVRLMVDTQGRVIRSKSAYLPAFRQNSTSTMKARRKAMKQKLSVMLDLLEMQHQDIIDEVVVDIDHGAPFTSHYHTRYPAKTHAGSALTSWLYDNEPDTDSLTGLAHYIRMVGLEVATGLANRRLDKVCIDRTQYWRDRYTRSDYVNKAPISAQPEDLRALITPSPKEVKDRVVADLMKLAGLGGADGRVEHPLFGRLPRVWYGPARSEPEQAYDPETYSKLVSRKGVIY
jgi:hypothetical protein